MFVFSSLYKVHVMTVPFEIIIQFLWSCWGKFEEKYINQVPLNGGTFLGGLGLLQLGR